MTASLIVEVPGQPRVEIRLDPEVITVGRSDKNTLPLRDMNVSRHHFTIERRPHMGYVLQDRGSRNGTLVNGVSVLNKVLVEGDRLQAGGSVLTFRAKATDAAQPLRPTGQNVSSKPTIALRATDGATPPTAIPRPGGRSVFASGGPGSGTFELPIPTARSTGGEPAAGGAEAISDDRWRKLAEVAFAVNLEHDIDRLLETILDAVLALVPAKAGFLVMREEGLLRLRAKRGAPEVAVGMILSETSDDVRISRQICREAIDQKRPVLTQDAASDSELGSYQTVMNLQLKSILCVPFSSQDEVLGVVYLDEPAGDPFADEGAVVELVGAFGDMAGIALANARLLSEIAARERLEEELRIAARMQALLLPATSPKVRGLELAGRTRAARMVGGDIFDFFTRSEPARDLLVSIGDVAGKGVGAGMVMASVRALLHAYAEVYERTDELLCHLNTVLTRDLDPGIFVSFLLMRYSEETGTLHYTGCGHEHLVLFRPSTGQLECVRAGGVVLGLAPRLEGRIQERRLDLKPGDVVCLYTDGATEAVDAKGEEFGLERVGAAVRAGPLEPEAVVGRVMDAVLQFAGVGAEQHDDLTVVALRRV